MLGLFVHKDQWEEADQLIDLNNLPPDDVVRRLRHWRLYIFQESARRTVAAVVFRLGGLLKARDEQHSAHEPKLIEDETVSAVVAALSQPKVGALTREEFRGFHHGYKALADRRLIGDTNADAHRAWVTRKVEGQLMRDGEWSHSVTVTVEFSEAPFRETVTDLAVSEAHAIRKAAKLRRDMRQRLGFAARDPKYRFITSIRPCEAQSAPPVQPPATRPIDGYREIILRTLADGRVATNRELQSACGTKDWRERNRAAWAMVRLQKEGRIVKVGGQKRYRMGEGTGG